MSVARTAGWVEFSAHLFPATNCKNTDSGKGWIKNFVSRHLRLLFQQPFVVGGSQMISNMLLSRR